jgi:hypothetical protein
MLTLHSTYRKGQLAATSTLVGPRILVSRLPIFQQVLPSLRCGFVILSHLVSREATRFVFVHLREDRVRILTWRALRGTLEKLLLIELFGRSGRYRAGASSARSQ